MKQYTLEEWNNLSEIERVKHNAEIMQEANFDITKVEICNKYGVWNGKGSFNIDYYWQYRLKPIPIEPTQEGITAKFVKDNNLKIGDKVKVVRKFVNEEWQDWSGYMDKHIGEFGKIIAIVEIWIGLKFDDGSQWRFLPQSLEVVKYRPFKDGAEFETYKGNKQIRFKKEDTLSRLGIVELQTYNLDTIKVSSEKRMSFYDAFNRLEFVNSVADETGKPFGVEL